MPLLSVVIPVYRNGAQARQTLDALMDCRLPPDASMEIVLVDDASGDDTLATLANYQSLRKEAAVQVHVHACNAGRAATRNTGARASTGTYLLFLDADCVPDDTDFLLSHLASFEAADVSMGTVQGNSRDFWHHYQRAAGRRREARMAKHPELLLTSANVMLGRASFFDAGGFDERYRGYGFEDRALAAALRRRGMTFAICDRAVVRHEDRLTLKAVCAKLQDAAQGNGYLFGSECPEDYRLLGYAAIDARLHQWMRWPSKLVEPLRKAMIEWLSPRLDSSALSLHFKLRAVRWLCAASYLRGSALAAAFCRKSA